MTTSPLKACEIEALTFVHDPGAEPPLAGRESRAKNESTRGALIGVSVALVALLGAAVTWLLFRP
ncbi:MAG TPA: hypothetical protein VEU54_03650 [Steroidobacteraceae bacterium]|jgi:hypothetical protein|nr:hypothetical protein [Steroidobacteraceae bacterium]